MKAGDCVKFVIPAGLCHLKQLSLMTGLITEIEAENNFEIVVVQIFVNNNIVRLRREFLEVINESR